MEQATALGARFPDPEWYRACNPAYEELLDAAYAIAGDGPFQRTTITIDGEQGEYVLIATSYAD